MIRYILVWLTLLLQFSLWGQIQLKPLKSINEPRSNGRIDQVFNTLNLPFWDDFSQSRNVPDSLLWESGNSVFVNNNLAIHPPSQYVATFDGTNMSGNPYALNSLFNGAGDSLVTHPIDLSQIAPSKRSQVLLSFYWQLLGRGEIPELEDSLAVMFWSIDSTWVLQDLYPEDETLFSLVGGLDQLNLDADSLPSFQQIIIPVSGSEFYHPSFKVKFQSFSSLNGIYDTWNLDYIYLNENRNSDDFSHQDRTLSAAPSLLFSPYYEIPLTQYLSDPSNYITPQYTTANNLYGLPSPLEYVHSLTNQTNGNAISTGSVALFRLSALETGRKVEGLGMEVSLINIEDDSALIESTFTYNTGDKFLYEQITTEGDTLFSNTNLRANDTLRQYYQLNDHYAFDDGTADFAAGINFMTGKLAVRFVVNEPDTLTGMKINFPSVNPSSNGKGLELMVWDGLLDSGVLHRQSFQIVNNDRQDFNEIVFSQNIYVKDTIYIGFKQFTEDYIGIGFDKDNPLGMDAIFSNTGTEWEQNTRLQGALMIRAVFGKVTNSILGTPENKLEAHIYPNPSDGLIHISDTYDHYFLYNLSGKMIADGGFNSTLDFRTYPKGIYLLNLQYGSSLITQKILIEK
jgi:hypothetical protein